jgi:hypothetical protein
MRAAPAFELTLRVGQRERVLIGIWCALSCAVLAAWLVAHGWALWRHDAMSGRWPVLAALAGGVAAFLVAWPLTRRDAATLRWNQGVWTLARAAHQASSIAGALMLRLDLGPWMLVRFDPADRSRSHWFGVSASDAGVQWPAFRAALYRSPVSDTVGATNSPGDPFS